MDPYIVLDFNRQNLCIEISPKTSDLINIFKLLKYITKQYLCGEYQWRNVVTAGPGAGYYDGP